MQTKRTVVQRNMAWICAPIEFQWLVEGAGPWYWRFDYPILCTFPMDKTSRRFAIRLSALMHLRLVVDGLTPPFRIEQLFSCLKNMCWRTHIQYVSRSGRKRNIVCEICTGPGRFFNPRIRISRATGPKFYKPCWTLLLWMSASHDARAKQYKTHVQLFHPTWSGESAWTSARGEIKRLSKKPQLRGWNACIPHIANSKPGLRKYGTHTSRPPWQGSNAAVARPYWCPQQSTPDLQPNSYSIQNVLFGHGVDQRACLQKTCANKSWLSTNVCTSCLDNNHIFASVDAPYHSQIIWPVLTNSEPYTQYTKFDVR